MKSSQILPWLPTNTPLGNNVLPTTTQRSENYHSLIKETLNKRPHYVRKQHIKIATVWTNVFHKFLCTFTWRVYHMQIPTKHILCSGDEKRKQLELCLAHVADWLPCLHHRPLLNYVICSRIIKLNCLKWQIIKHCAVWCYCLPVEHRKCGIPIMYMEVCVFPGVLRVRGQH
jgi:hypothetical protein